MLGDLTEIALVRKGQYVFDEDDHEAALNQGLGHACGNPLASAPGRGLVTD